MHLASAGFGAAMTVAARLAAATMAVVVFCMAWSSGMLALNECTLEPKIPPGHTRVALFLTHPVPDRPGLCDPEPASDARIATNTGTRRSGMRTATIRAGAYTARSRHES